MVRQEKREELGLGISDFVIISVGELNDNKNHKVIIRALVANPDVKYVIVGKGVLEQKLRDLSTELGVSDRVILTGFRMDVRDLLWMSDCFAFPSKREGLGIAALEGMAAGLPVLGHDIGGIRDFVIDGETGWLVKGLDDWRVYSEVIKKNILTMSDLMKNSAAAKEMAEHFSKAESERIMKEIYESK